MISVRKGYLTGLFVLSYMVMMAQGGSPLKPTPDFMAKMSEVLPNAPNTAAIEKFGGVDVELNTGVVKKSIELKPFTFRDISVPIRIGFNTLGLRVTEHPTRVGMGWNLLTGGLISRVIYGKDDLLATRVYPSFTMSPNAEGTQTSTFCYNTLYYGNNDVTPDIFSYNFGEYSGKFFFDNQGVIQPILATNVQFIYQTDQQTSGAWNFKAITPDGTQYFFGGTIGRESSKIGSSILFNQYSPNSWQLIKITDPHGYSVNFTYQEYTMDAVLTSVEETQIANSPDCGGSACPDDPTFPDGCLANNLEQVYVASKVLLLQEISDDEGGEVQFTYSSQGYPEKLLTTVEYYTPSSSLYSKYEFSYDYIVPTGGTTLPFLSTIKEKGAQGSLISNGHSFSYYNLSQVPKRFTYSQDHWGFFNNKVNSTLVPTPENWQLAASFPLATADRSPDPTYAVAGMLKEINYPTGGKDVIVYEPNTFTETKDVNGYESINKSVIGLYDGSYTCSSGTSFTIGYDPLIKVDATTVYTQSGVQASHPDAYIVILDASSNEVTRFDLDPNILPNTTVPVTQIFFYNLSAGTYTVKACAKGEYIQITGILTKRDGVTANMQEVQTVTGGMRVQKVTTSDNSGGPDMIKRYYYGNLATKEKSSAFYYTQPKYYTPFTLVDGKLNGCGFTCSKTFYHSALHSTSLLKLYTMDGKLSVYTSVIESFGGDNFENGAVEHKYSVATDYPALNIRGNMADLFSPYTNGSVWGLGETEAVTYKKSGSNLVKVKKTEFVNYVDSANLRDLDFYFITQLGQLPCAAWNAGLVVGPYPVIHSNFLINKFYITCVWKYLKTQRDFVYDENGANPVISEVNYTYDDVDHLTLTKRTFTNSKGELFSEHFTYPADYPSTSPYTTMVQKNIVDPVIEQTNKLTQSGNTKELSKLKTNYQEWFGGTSTPYYEPSIIEKSISGNALETEYTINSYDNKGNILQTTDRKGIKTSYYWGYGQRYPVVKVVGKTYAELESAISAYSISTSVIGNLATTDAAMRTELNKFRSMTNCFVSTYTYKLPAGMTSETDPNGFSKYYEYDQFDRLVLVRDQNNRIVKKVCYNYNGMAEDCTSPTIYYNDELSQSFTKNNCVGCYTGSQVTYTVAAGLYSATTLSAANQLAQNDINANGQAYANANGSCVPTSGTTLSYNNIAGQSGFTATYTKTKSPYTQYQFAVPASGSGTLGCIPADSYTLVISRTPPGGTPPLLLFGNGCSYVSGTNSATITTSVGGLSNCNSVTIDYDN